jgi:hypothetical protein
VRGGLSPRHCAAVSPVIASEAKQSSSGNGFVEIASALSPLAMTTLDKAVIAASPRHCERSEAIQYRDCSVWIASSLRSSQ